MSVKENKTSWTTRGSVRGCCGHKHKRIGSAIACIGKDSRDCVSVGGYSDRHLVKMIDGNEVEMDEYDYAEADCFVG